MALTVKTIVKIFLLFFAYQVCMNMFITLMPAVDTDITQDNQEYLNFISQQVNGKIDAEGKSQTLLDNFKSSIATENLFNESIAQAFLGVLKVIMDVTLFLAELALAILFTPGVIIQILTYNFIISTSNLYLLGIMVNVFFYMTLFHIIFKRRISQG